MDGKCIYNLPYLQRMELCAILNQNDKWAELAGVWMGYNVLDIQSFKKEHNPADELLTKWGHYNHTILELFILLSRMQHYQAMIPLKPFVDQKYHPLLDNGEGNLQKLLKDTKDLKIGTQNFNQNLKHENATKKILSNSAKEDSVKILNRAIPFEQNDTRSNSNNILASMPTIFSTSLPCISFKDLATASDNWKKENLLGKGGFGSVFKGILKNTEVAIKKIEPRGGTDYDESYALQLEQSFREIKILNSLPHENILPLYAYSVGGEAPCLVYQYMKNGSLEDRLRLKFGTAPLNWLQRLEIAKGTARGLQYLHTIRERQPLIHGDIKSANILLDKNFEPKIGDFGLAREGSSDDSLKVSRIQGTRPYLPEEYIYGRNLSSKIDTYSYGIVCYELATGLPAYDKTRHTCKSLKEFLGNIPKKDLHLLKDKLAGETFDAVFNELLEIGDWCSQRDPDKRPEMPKVYAKLAKSITNTC
ncbi:hypothetical protein QAD02_015181 [Eretmocerus hayati]|uniref:Uncharacterized protein n=1 Tax=Eretmocerus hayati TaxID=131215 RepID=A0ACC2P7Y1_9HYME|nr:hypothetical protein QAD02_015181 [Eretmocerus hayati]